MANEFAPRADADAIAFGEAILARNRVRQAEWERLNEERRVRVALEYYGEHAIVEFGKTPDGYPAFVRVDMVRYWPYGHSFTM